MDTLVTIHSLYRWVALAALLYAVLIALLAMRRGAVWTDERRFSTVAILFDVQVALGIVVWLAGPAWSKHGAFFTVIHPVATLAALGVFHAAVARARTLASAASFRVLALGGLVSLILVIAAIPWDRL